MKGKSLIWPLFASYLLVTFIAIGLMFLVASSMIKNDTISHTIDELKSETTLIEGRVSHLIESKDTAQLTAILTTVGPAVHTRFTIIDPSGTVLADSNEPPSLMDNHANRPEIIQSLSQEWGTAIRYSTTLGTTMLYISKPIYHQAHLTGFIRSAIPITKMDIALANLRKKMVIWGIAVCVFSAGISILISIRIKRHISTLTAGAEHFSNEQFDYQIPVPTVQEFKTLAIALNTMATQLNNRMQISAKQAQEKAALDEMRRNFVANVSHELKTPITLIKGFLETLTRGAINNINDRDEFLGIIQNHANRLDEIIDDLLMLSRIEQDHETDLIQTARLDVTLVIRRAIDACQAKAEARKVMILFHHIGTQMGMINDSLLQQALINLIDNAIKYSPTNGTVTLSVDTIASDIKITVTDHGCGIPPEHIPHLFERFYRVDKARSRQLGGTGLGLAIVKHIVQAQRGRIAVESVELQGSQFSIFLPVG